MQSLPAPPLPDTRPPLLRTSGEDTILPDEPLTRAQVSCWYSHYQVLLKIARGEDEVAIVLEDDVDMENPLVHPVDLMLISPCPEKVTACPMRTKIHQYEDIHTFILPNTSFAHTHTPSLVREQGDCVEPAVVIQTKDTVSDIVSGTGGAQTEWLADSALQRVAYYEKLRQQRELSEH
ncbi:hypothetical protein BN14_00742 [Rhizoctonia solani AG-1 IB]|uniref:Glycosyl transferase family 25 domain-containing protein n=1 Tax=Thanatephorus cucumeris (strain AG1-IB / isolate 7/3/14) TaxID=1108050 RepID=M5BJA4_THACB|nr:hypothetical protein BN14_00742 [Rhizoctonia solani AG-1 IB]